MEGCKSSDVAHIEALMVNAKALRYVSMAWVNSCDERWAHRIVQLKKDLCIVDYYGEEIRGKEYRLHSTNRGLGQLLLEKSVATPASSEIKGCSTLLAVRESSEGLSAGSIDYDTDYNDYSEDDF